MAVRSRGGGLRIWAAILAVYALLLHAPAMATMGLAGDGVAASSEHSHHTAATQSAEPDDTAPGHAERDTCCVVCGGGPCAVGPIANGGINLPLPLARARRLRRTPKRRLPSSRADIWFQARGPPAGM